MKTTHVTNYQKEYAYTEYTYNTCQRIRKIDSLFITNNKEKTQQSLCSHDKKLTIPLN